MHKRFDIVFQGGGARGIVLNGAMRAFERRGFEPRRVVGTSAGAIAAICVAAGYTGRELVDMSFEKTPSGEPIFSEYLDKGPRDSWPPGTKAQWGPINFSLHGGFYTGGGFVSWLRDKLEAKGRGLGSATFEEFHLRTGSHVTVVASDVVAQRMLVLNHITAPACPVIWAVRCSMSIPLFFEEMIWQPSWGPYLGKNIAKTVIVDGGIISNFPLRLVLPCEAAEAEVYMGPREMGHAETLGLMIDTTMPVPNAPPPPREPAEELIGLLGRLPTVRRLTRVMNTAIDGNDVTEELEHPNVLCRLPAKDYDATEFFMSDARVRALVSGGELACREYLDRRFPHEVKPDERNPVN